MYPILDITIPQAKKREINQKILHIIDSGQKHPQITPNIIFNSYSPLGSIHGLEFKNYDNFHQFQEAKKHVTHSQYFTPLKLSKWLSSLLSIPKDWKVADITAGHGSLINFLQVPDENIYCNEWELKAYKVLKYLFPNINHSNKDIREYNSDTQMDCIIGNPPFSITWQYNSNTYNSEVFYLLKSAELLKPSSLCAIIVPESFLMDDFSDKGNINLINNHFNFVSQFILPTNIFESVGAKITTKIMIFQKKSNHITERPYINGQHNRIVLESLDHITATKYYNEYIKPLYEQKEKVKSKLLLEALQQGSEKNNQFEYKVKKMLFDIKRGKQTKKHYDRAEAYLLKFKTQEKPHEMKFEEWVKIRITENKVLAYLKKILKEQHKQHEKDITALVKTRYGLKMKAYNRKQVKLLKAYNGITEITFNDMVLNNNYPFSDKKYLKLYNRKLKEYNRQNKPFSDITADTHITEWLDNFSLYNSEGEIQLNDIQKHDANLILQKRYGFLQWDTGTGKSLMAICFAKYHLEHSNINNVFIVAPAIAINGTFKSSLTDFNIPFRNIKSIKDINNIKQGEIVIITFNMLIKYQRQLKKFIKINNNKIATVIDESDSICTITSKRSKACFSVLKHSKFKLLTTATSVRNTINESFAEFSFLYLQSANFINKCEKILVENKKTGELEEKENPYYLKPYPMHTKGLKLFKESHSPNKQTVFGLSKNSQSIYHSAQLKELINKSIITRSFEEITGRNISKMIQHTCKFSSNEYDLYKRIVEEFYTITNSYKTGNSRKDAMLKIIAQLNSMIRCCSASHLIKGSGVNLSQKFKKVLDLLESFSGEHVVIGCRFKDTVNSYAYHIKQRFPNRKVFVITGENTTVDKRKEIIKEMKNYKDAVLICTQQALSSSISINYIDKIIISENGWNSAGLKQFWARFVRFDSQSDNKEIHFISYEDSIEINLTQLILRKESFNLYMKNEEVEEEELNDRFGIDFDILNMLMTKEVDSEGKSYLAWGSQKIV